MNGWVPGATQPEFNRNRAKRCGFIKPCRLAGEVPGAGALRIRAAALRVGGHLIASAVAWIMAFDAPAQSGDNAERFHEFVRTNAQAAIARGETVVAGSDGWLFLAVELRHIGAGEFRGNAAPKASRATSPDRADPLPAIVDFQRQLQSAGVELWVVPVPPKALIHASALEPNAAPNENRRARLDVHHQAFYRRLRDEGVHVVDLTREFLDAMDSNDPPLYCRTDSHWSGHGLLLAARMLATRIKSHDWYAGIPKGSFDIESREVAISGDLAHGRGGKENIPLRVVGIRQGGVLERVEPAADSPVLLLGDSHNLVFHAGNDMHARGAGLPDQLAAELGFAVDLIAVRGSGATPARVNLLRRARRDTGYLKTKKLVIWCFAAREFTESDGWAMVPVIQTPDGNDE